MNQSKKPLPPKLLWSDGDKRVVALNVGTTGEYDRTVSETKHIDRLGNEAWTESEDTYNHWALCAIANGHPLAVPAQIPLVTDPNGFAGLTAIEAKLFRAIEEYYNTIPSAAGAHLKASTHFRDATVKEALYIAATDWWRCVALPAIEKQKKGG